MTHGQKPQGSVKMACNNPDCYNPAHMRVGNRSKVGDQP